MKELEMIFSVAKKENKNYLNKNITKQSSFYEKKLLSGMNSLDVDTPIKLQKQLHAMWRGDEQLEKLEKIIVVAAFKLKNSETQIKDIIQEKVYNF